MSAATEDSGMEIGRFDGSTRVGKWGDGRGGVSGLAGEISGASGAREKRGWGDRGRGRGQRKHRRLGMTLTVGSHLPRGERERGGYRFGFGLLGLGPIAGSAQWVPFSFFSDSFFSVLLHNFCILAPNCFKQICNFL
jgi:hypothetical protein